MDVKDTIKFNQHWEHKPGTFTLCYLVGILPDGTLNEHAMLPGSDPWFFFEFWSAHALDDEDDLIYEFEFITDGEVYCLVDFVFDDKNNMARFEVVPPCPIKGYSDHPNFPCPLRYHQRDDEVPQEEKNDNWWRLNVLDQQLIKNDMITYMSKA